MSFLPNPNAPIDHHERTVLLFLNALEERRCNPDAPDPRDLAWTHTDRLALNEAETRFHEP
jgi:hypothetical protein